jgi:hypothetical protein
VGVEETLSKAMRELEVYPNPARHTVVIDTEGFDGIVNEVAITTIQGKTSALMQHPGKSKTEVPIGHLNDGMYLLQFRTNKGLVTKKLSVQK